MIFLILIQFYGYLKDKFGEKIIIEKKNLEEETIFSIITNNMIEKDKQYFLDIVQNNPYLIILKNEKSIEINTIYNEKIQNGDILKIYLSVSGG